MGRLTLKEELWVCVCRAESDPWTAVEQAAVCGERVRLSRSDEKRVLTSVQLCHMYGSIFERRSNMPW